MLLICYPKCTTCQKAKKWLESNGIAFEERHIAEQNPTAEELGQWQGKKRPAEAEIFQNPREAK